MMRCESCFGAGELMKSGGIRGFCEVCSDKMTCPDCKGMKQLMGNGGLTKDCKRCYGKGTIKKELEIKDEQFKELPVKKELETVKDEEIERIPVKTVIKRRKTTKEIVKTGS